MNILSDFNQKLILEDEVVLLRPLELSDYDNLLPFTHNEPQTWHYSLQRPDTEENLHQYLSAAISDRENKTSYPFIVFDKRSNSFAGSTRFYDINPGYRSAQLGYTWYGEDFRGTKLNKHCKFLLLRYAFETLELERVEFRADKNNSRSIAAMKSIGCTVEGVLRSHMPTIEGGRRDTIVLSILRDEWFKNVKSALQSAVKLM
ncbi:MAG: GNAT family N-acetyltransferase [Flavobacterium sp.]|nr:GNAT family N-acetyltransferase [Flavobacterium sp.]